MTTTTLQDLGNHSWNDFVAKAARRITEAAARGADDVSISGLSEWAGTSSLAAAVDMAVKGWPQGAARIAAKLDTLPATSEVLPEWNLDVSGAICNVPAFLSGEPECMWRMSDCKRDEHRVSIIVSGTYSAAVEASSAQNYATAVAAVIRSLEASGINPAVYMIGASRHSGGTLAYSINVREFGEPLDLARVAFAFHPSFLRRIQFGWRELTPEAVAAGAASGGYGSVVKLTSDLVTKLLGDIGYVAVVPDLNSVYHQSLDAMIETLHTSVNETLNQIR